MSGANELPLFSRDAETSKETAERQHKNREAFDEFHRANPRIYQKLASMARQLKTRGRERYSVKTLYEVIRWQGDVTTNAEDFKLNNNYVPFYARLIMKEYPELEGFFELREMKG